MVAVTGCGKEESGGREIVLTTGFYADEVFRLEGVSCAKKEVNIYLTNIMNQYSNVYGEGIWTNQATGGNLSADLKETVLARVVKIKVMSLMGEHYGLVLNQSEVSQAEQAANAYYNSLSEAERNVFDQISVEEITSMYEEYAMADKVYQYITKDVNTQISDDEARCVTVEQIVVYKDSSVSQNEVDPAATRIASLKARTRDESFADLASLYNEAPENKTSVLRGQLDISLENIIFNLSMDEISDIVETNEAYYIYHCVSTMDYSSIESTKQQIVNLRKQKLFNDTYDAFAKDYKVYLNEELWNPLVPVYGGDVDTADFFDIYQNHFPQQ